jgi:ubiquinone biosynthesis protein
MRPAWRALRIARVLLRHGLDEFLIDTPWARWRFILKPFSAASGAEAQWPRGARLRAALEELGPIFVKFGQVLSTRRDLMPADVADELAKLRDQVAPFSGIEARVIIETALSQPISALFSTFDETALASASIAQVHAATMHDGRRVVVKVLRPNIHQRVADDIALLRFIATRVAAHHPRADKIRPLDVVQEIENTLQGELDLQREGANASQMRRLWTDSNDLYVPEVFWDYTRENVLTLERVSGIAADDVEALRATGIDPKAVAAKGVRVFYNSVFRDNFFHADAHGGNLWVDADRKDDPRFVAIDFGIVGQLSEQDQYYLAENFMAIFQKDYRRIAELHIQAGWMPAHIRLDELEAATRAVCEPYFTRPLAEISLGEVLMKLFKTAQRYELTIQPQLILLQKTLLNIEGVARTLDPKIDIWEVAQPVLETILRKRYSFTHLRKEFRKRLPELISQAPEMPRLLRNWLAQQVEGDQRLHIESDALKQMAKRADQAERRTVFAMFALGSGAFATLAQIQQWGGALWQNWHSISMAATAVALMLAALAWPRKS